LFARRQATGDGAVASTFGTRFPRPMLAVRWWWWWRCCCFYCSCRCRRGSFTTAAGRHDELFWSAAAPRRPQLVDSFSGGTSASAPSVILSSSSAPIRQVESRSSSSKWRPVAACHCQRDRGDRPSDDDGVAGMDTGFVGNVFRNDKTKKLKWQTWTTQPLSHPTT
jgi:hypothetical protein